MSATRTVLIPARPEDRSQLADFSRLLERDAGRPLHDPMALHRHSVERWPDFWRRFVEWSDIPREGDLTRTHVGEGVEHTRFFPELRLNYTEALLHARSDDRAPAIIALDENGARVEISRGRLNDRVRSTAAGLTEMGLCPGEHVAAVARNDLETIVAALAVIGLGGVWSSVSPDLGMDTVLARFAPLRPRWIMAHPRSTYQGRALPIAPLLERLRDEIPSIEHAIELGDDRSLATIFPNARNLRSLERAPEITAWRRFAFDHPLFVMFSSGTTGPPKCIVHGAGGTLLEHLKEHRLHGDLGPSDRVFFHTGCGWMMWNWLLSALAAGATIVLRDGSPTHPDPDALWKMIQDERVTHFGVNPTYLGYCRDLGVSPGRTFDLSSLHAAMSTGSILFDGLFDWFLENAARVPLQSISGGTDIIGCFVLGHPHRPLIRGESQMLSLALDVQALDPETGRMLSPGKAGELVCANPFPSRPVGFLGDDGAQRYHEAYYSQNTGYWTHGDFIAIHEDGGARMLGRSDGVLNVRGVRIGPSEIYAVLHDFPQITQTLAVEQKSPDSPGGSRIVLLAVMRAGDALDRALTLAIKKALKTRASTNHVPDLIVEVSALPTTFSGKLSEKAARDAVNGRVASNRAALRNPEILDQIRERVAP